MLGKRGFSNIQDVFRRSTGFKQYFQVLLILSFACNINFIFAQDALTRFEHITSDDGLPQNTVLGIVKDKYGFIWFGTWNGLCRFDGYNYKTYIYEPQNKNSINNNRIHTIKLDNDKNLWVRTFENDELCRYSYENDNFERFNRGVVDDSLFVWTDRRKHVETNSISFKEFTWHIDVQKNRMVEYNRLYKSTKVYTQGSSNPGELNDPYVTDIYKDNHNILWIGTYSNGINKVNLNAKPFAHYYHDPYKNLSLIDNNVTAISEDKQGDIWIGTRDKGITVIGAKGRHITQQPGSITNNQVRAIFCDSKDIMWIGTKEGLNRYDPRSGIFQDYSGQVLNTSVFGITEDREHNILFATWSGMYKFDRKKNMIISFDIEKLKLHRHTRIIFEDSKGFIWVGSEGEGGATGGVTVLEPIGINSYRPVYRFLHNETKNSISDNRINCIFEDKEGIIWIGTGNGLDKYDPVRKRFTNLSAVNRFPKSSVMAILEDNKGYLWISHKKGISQLSKKNLNIRTFTLQDGLQSQEFAGGAAFSSLKQNKLYFGGNNGFNVFNPDHILPEMTLPNTVLTELQILNRKVGINDTINGRVVLRSPLYLTKEIYLKHSDKSISIEFAGLHFSNPQANKYAYKLEGFDKDWIYTDANRRVATYSNLKSGNYVFKVISSNSDGVWNEKPAVLYIEVLPPFWASNLAFILYGIALLSCLYAYHIYSVRISGLKSKLAYEALLHEQEQELQQNKLQFFTNISHEIKTPLSLILAPLERMLGIFAENNAVYSQLLTMQASGNRLLKLVNQLLDFRKLETGNLLLNLQQNDVIVFIIRSLESFRDVAVIKNIHLSFRHDVDSCAFPYDEDKMEKVLYNLLSNALKFTPESGWIEITFLFRSEPGGQNAVIEVSNLGNEPIPEEDHELIFLPFKQGKKHTNVGTGLGLAFSRGLAELHGGTLTVVSKNIHPSTSRTTFTVTLPLKPQVKTALPPTEEKEHAGAAAIAGTIMHETGIKANVNDKADVNKLYTMLIVEDNTEMREYLKDYFSGLYRILDAANGKAGLEVAQNELPDIILSDVMMDEMNGFELCRKVKLDSRTAHIPVVLLTAQALVESEIEGIETGADDYISKPFNLSTLSGRIRNLLTSRHALKEKYRKEISLNPTSEVPQSADEKLLQKLLAFIEKNLSDSGLGVDEICSGVGVSRSQLYRKVKDMTGLSLSEVLREIRLKKAKVFLSEGKFTVNEVADMVGFSDADYFRKCFKSEFGIAPSEYLKKGILK